MKKLTERNVGISSDDDMIDITTSGTMTERTLNQRSPINLPGNIIIFNIVSAWIGWGDIEDEKLLI